MKKNVADKIKGAGQPYNFYSYPTPIGHSHNPIAMSKLFNC